MLGFKRSRWAKGPKRKDNKVDVKTFKKENDYFVMNGNTAKWKGPKIQMKTLRLFISFGRAILDEYDGEAFAVLIEKDGQIRLQIVEQVTSGMHVSWKNEPPELGWRQIGTIHTHCDCSAFFSGEDISTYNDMEGLHICVGKLNSSTPQVVACIVSGDNLVKIKTSEVLNKYTHPRKWEKKVTCDYTSLELEGLDRQSFLKQPNSVKVLK